MQVIKNKTNHKQSKILNYIQLITHKKTGEEGKSPKTDK